MATALLAIGAMSVMVVLATATGFASNRQTKQRLAQVLEEAGNEAKATVNEFVASKDRSLPGDEDGVIAEKRSELWEGFGYELKFAPVDKEFPEAGFEVQVVVRYGDDLEQHDTLYVNKTLISEEEFMASTTYEEERAGSADETGGQER